MSNACEDCWRQRLGFSEKCPDCVQQPVEAVPIVAEEGPNLLLIGMLAFSAIATVWVFYEFGWAIGLRIFAGLLVFNGYVYLVSTVRSPVWKFCLTTGLLILLKTVARYLRG